MKPHVFHVLAPAGFNWWVIADGRRVMTSIPGEPRSVLVGRWEWLHGRHPDGYQDVLRTLGPDEIGDELCILAERLRLDTAAPKGGAT